MTFEAAQASKVTVSNGDDDRRAITLVRDAFLDADNAGDADAMTRLMADDIVVLHPYCGVIDGKNAVRSFMGRVLADVHAEFDKHARCSTIELKVSGDLAYERGTLLQLLTPKAGGAVERDEGMYLWIYERRDGVWLITRIAGSLTQADESADGETEGGC
jgi:uncharacterized protein (TIGR02246 family)